MQPASGAVPELPSGAVGTGHVGVDGFQRQPRGLQGSIGVVAWLVEPERGGLAFVVVLGGIGDFLGDFLRNVHCKRQLRLVFKERLAISREELHVDGGVVDADLLQELGGGVQVTLGAAGIDLAAVGVGGHLLEHGRRQPSAEPFPPLGFAAVAQGVEDLDARVHGGDVGQLPVEGKASGLRSVVEHHDIGLSGQGVDGPHHGHDGGDARAGGQQEVPCPPVGVGQVECPDRSEHLEDGAGFDVLVHPRRDQSRGVALDGDV